MLRFSHNEKVTLSEMLVPLWYYYCQAAAGVISLLSCRTVPAFQFPRSDESGPWDEWFLCSWSFFHVFVMSLDLVCKVSCNFSLTLPIIYPKSICSFKAEVLKLYWGTQRSLRPFQRICKVTSIFTIVLRYCLPFGSHCLKTVQSTKSSIKIQIPCHK